MAAVIMLGVAVLTIASIFVATGTYTRVNHAMYERERAFQLADSGIVAAILDMNGGGSGTIAATNSQAYFLASNRFTSAVWSFSTTVSNASASMGTIISVGRYGESSVTVRTDVEQSLEARNIHALYAHALYAGNSSGDTNYILEIGGTGGNADFVDGDVYSGNDLDVTGDARLRLPEDFTDDGTNGYDIGEDYTDSGTLAVHSNALTRPEYNTYTGTVNVAETYPNGKFDYGEAFVDTIGNGVYDSGESFTDLDGDGVYGFGEPYVDTDGDGVFDAGETFVDHGNGQYDVGEPYQDVNGNGAWDPAQAGWSEWVRVGWRWRRINHPSVPAEPYEDVGNGVYDPDETFTDVNNVYDPGEEFFDDRNDRYDYGTQATGDISGMQDPGTSQLPASGGSTAVSPPDLETMYYDQSNSGTAPGDAANGWGHDIDVASANFNSDGEVTDPNDPAHIFVKNPDNRRYSPVNGKDDYFLEDPTDPSYGNSSQFIDVQDNGNDKVYYVDGNLYIHNPHTYDFMFRDSGVRITIVANGNITISDEFWYNGGTANPLDSLALIAKKDPNEPDSGNIYLGDAQYGTGGDVHAMLFAENDFVDNNLDTSGQPYLSVFGNMTAGNHVAINRSGQNRTRLDITFDERIVSLQDLPPGLPQAPSGERSIMVLGDWTRIIGTWSSHSPLANIGSQQSSGYAY